MKVLIAHAEGEAEQAKKLDAPLREAGYKPVHYGTILVGESLTEEAGKVLNSNGPVVLCGTIKATGTRFARRLVNAARSGSGAVRVFPVRIEEEADLEALTWDGKPAEYWQNPTKAAEQVIESLKQYYPLNADARQVIRQHSLEERYRELALKSCDIVDLTNLPEDDRHLASRELELRRLYVALRMQLEIKAGDEADEKTLLALEALEERRSKGWGRTEGYRSGEEERVALGERLAEVQRLVVLGDPGAGKSTLLRWLATAYLLRLQQHPDWRDLPDVASLPDKDWLPILIRCRDLPPEAADCLETMLQHSLRKSEFPQQECANLCALLRNKLEQGEALLLVDGLDEITEPGARARFAQQIEQISRAYEQAPLIVTSRIVGYREMGYRLRAGFEHLTVADLSKEDKDDFARRWCALTERSERRETAAEELIRDMHSSDRIERLTGNPMLLTTMALIKRKLNRLPQRRVDLYEKAVEVLLNWRSAVDEPLDPREALPQLEYLAYAMCVQGIQQIREDQVLDLLRRVREEYPNIHPLRQHSPEEFLGLLERRTGLLIQSGHTRHKGRSEPVYEFRHLTFQEYLAGIALVAGHYQGRDKSKSLAEVIAPLAGQMEMDGEDHEKKVKENWREVLRLCLAACNDDDVDAALLAILHPLPDELGTVRPRSVQAALCLADESNVSEVVAQEVLLSLVKQVTIDDGKAFLIDILSLLDIAILDIAASRWANLLKEYLLDEFFRCDDILGKRSNFVGLYCIVQRRQVPSGEPEFSSWLAGQAMQLQNENCGEREAAAIVFSVIDLVVIGKNSQTPGIINGLIHCLSGSLALSHAASWALYWMNNARHKEYIWHPSPQQLQQLLTIAANQNCDSKTLYWLFKIFGKEKSIQSIPILLSHLPVNSSRIRQAIIEALITIGGEKTLAALKVYLQDKDEAVRCAVLWGLAKTCENEIDRKLLSKGLYGFGLMMLDPQAPITTARIAEAAEDLEQPEEEIARRYKELAQRFDLILEPEAAAMAGK
ncbi:MAG: NACHT domain-containing protein [Candidatus Electrothrix sp. Rat3]|nr:NACHT domain-containing protein [Candidatus Electrothrix rattekaaiensis]